MILLEYVIEVCAAASGTYVRTTQRRNAIRFHKTHKAQQPSKKNEEESKNTKILLEKRSLPQTSSLLLQI